MRKSKLVGFWGLTFSIAFSVGSDSQAETLMGLRNRILLIVQNAPASTVMNMLRSDIGGGVFGCYVSHPASTANMCNNYFVTSKAVNGYNGYPIYQDASASRSRYSAGAGRRMEPYPGVAAEASTGCFPHDARNSAPCWLGNTTPECTQAQSSIDEYAKSMLIKALKDPFDPCDLQVVVNEVESFANQMNGSSLLNRVRVSGLSCYLLLPDSTYSEDLGLTTCNFFRAQAAASGVTLQSMPAVDSVTYAVSTASVNYLTSKQDLLNQTNTAVLTTVNSSDSIFQTAKTSALQTQ